MSGGPKGLPGCRTEVLRTGGSALRLPGRPACLCFRAQWPSPQLSGSCHRHQRLPPHTPCQVQIKEKPKYISLCRNLTRVSRRESFAIVFWGPHCSLHKLQVKNTHGILIRLSAWDRTPGGPPSLGGQGVGQAPGTQGNEETAPHTRRVRGSISSACLRSPGLLKYSNYNNPKSP